MPHFRIRWRGYDTKEVDEFVENAAANQRRLEERLAMAQPTTTGDELRDDEARPRAVETARQIADAGDPARLLHLDRITANRQAIERISSLRQSLSAIEKTASALQGSGALFAAAGRPDPLTRSDDVAPFQLPRQTVETGAESASSSSHWFSRRTLLGGVGAVAVGLVAFVLLVDPPSMRQPEPAAETPAASQSDAAPQELTDNTPRPTVAAPVEQPVRDAETEVLVVTLSANADCWVSIQVDDAQPVERMLPGGDTTVLRVRERAQLRVGNAGALTMAINDRPARPLGTDGQVVSLELTPANYARYLAAP